MPGAPPTTATSPKLPLCDACSRPGHRGVPASQAQGVPASTPRRSSQTVPAWSRPWPVWQPGFRDSRASVCVARTAASPNSMPVSACRPEGRSTANTSPGWRLQSANGIGDGPRWRAIRSQAEHASMCRSACGTRPVHVVMDTPAACASCKACAASVGRREASPKQTHLHTAPCLVQPARGHQSIAAVVAGACPDLDAGSMGCDCLRQPRYSQAGACHQGVRRVLAQRGYLCHPRGAARHAAASSSGLPLTR
jgi:hypothetical protein